MLICREVGILPAIRNKLEYDVIHKYRYMIKPVQMLLVVEGRGFECRMNTLIAQLVPYIYVRDIRSVLFSKLSKPIDCPYLCKPCKHTFDSTGMFRKVCVRGNLIYD